MTGIAKPIGWAITPGDRNESARPGPLASYAGCAAENSDGNWEKASFQYDEARGSGIVRQCFVWSQAVIGNAQHVSARAAKVLDFAGNIHQNGVRIRSRNEGS